MLGGEGHVVEIDENLFGKRKYHKGKRTQHPWVFGGIDRNTGKCFLSLVPDLTANTLLPNIKSKIKLGTTIHSDCWKSYDYLQHENFQHLTVNHSITVKDKESVCHTNTIEDMRKHVKNLTSPTNRKLQFLPL